MSQLPHRLLANSIRVEDHVAPHLDGVRHVLVAHIQAIVRVECQRFVPQILELGFRISDARVSCECAVDLSLNKFVVDAVTPVVQSAAATLSVPEWPADGIDRATKSGYRRTSLLEFGKVLGGRCEAQRRRLAPLPCLHEAWQVECRLPVRGAVVGRQGQRKRVVQPNRQPDDIGIAGWHQKAQRRIVQRPYRAFPVILVGVQFV